MDLNLIFSGDALETRHAFMTIQSNLGHFDSGKLSELYLRAHWFWTRIREKMIEGREDFWTAFLKEVRKEMGKRDPEELMLIAQETYQSVVSANHESWGKKDLEIAAMCASNLRRAAGAIKIDPKKFLNESEKYGVERLCIFCI